MKIKTNCTKCGKTIEVHCDKWLSDKYTDEKLIELRKNIILELIEKGKTECYKCYFRMK